MTEVLSTTYELGADPEKNYSLLEPGIVARKYYARGVGVFLEVDPQSGEVSRLTACNVDPRCSQLP